MKQQLTAEEEKRQALEQQISNMEKQAAAQRTAPSATAAVQAAAASSGTLIGVKQSAPPTPAPTPVPGAPTPTPGPPRPTMPASYLEPLAFTFYVETLATTTTSKFGFASTVSCTPNSVFKRGMRLVWRFEVIDIKSGKRITEVDGATMTVRLPHGEELVGRFSQRGGGRVPDAPFMWSANWDIPLDFPLGGLDYEIIVKTKDGRTAVFKTPAIISPETDSRVKIIA